MHDRTAGSVNLMAPTGRPDLSERGSERRHRSIHHVSGGLVRDRPPARRGWSEAGPVGHPSLRLRPARHRDLPERHVEAVCRQPEIAPAGAVPTAPAGFRITVVRSHGRRIDVGRFEQVVALP